MYPPVLAREFSDFGLQASVIPSGQVRDGVRTLFGLRVGNPEYLRLEY
jgi:hypothetical protein